jgi:hypothetical protein
MQKLKWKVYWKKELVYINEYLNALAEKQNISNIRWDRSICKYVTIKRG